MKQTLIAPVSEALELGAATIGEATFFEMDCWTLLDTDGEVLIYEEKKENVTPFSDIKVRIDNLIAGSFSFYEVTAIII